MDLKHEFVKHGFKKGRSVKHGLLLPIHTPKIIRAYFLFCDVLYAFSRVYSIHSVHFFPYLS